MMTNNRPEKEERRYNRKNVIGRDLFLNNIIILSNFFCVTFKILYITTFLRFFSIV